MGKPNRLHGFRRETPAPSGLNVAVVQHDIVWESPERNFAALAGPIARASEEGADIVVLAETFSWGFTMNTDVASEPPDGPSTSFLVEQAERTGACLVGSVPIAEDGELPHYQMIVASPSGHVVRYNKQHPFTYSGEHHSYRAGVGSVTTRIGDVRVSLFVCFDLRFATEFWQLAPDTDCYLVIANWPASRRQHWRTLLQARAIENQAYVVGANRHGDDPNNTYCGDSMIIDPLGEVLCDAKGLSGDTTIHAHVDPARVAHIRREYPFLAERH